MRGPNLLQDFVWNLLLPFTHSIIATNKMPLFFFFFHFNDEIDTLFLNFYVSLFLLFHPFNHCIFHSFHSIN